MSVDALHILVVCTANQCRSPLIEFALRRRAEALELPWTITSAGTQAVPGRPPHPSAARLLEAHGDDVTRWHSQRLDRHLVGSADLVLTATVGIRNHVIRMHPQRAGMAFPFRQLARHYLQRDWRLRPGDRPADVRDRLAEARLALPAGPADADLPDPMGRSYRAFRRLDQLIEAGAEALV